MKLLMKLMMKINTLLSQCSFPKWAMLLTLYFASFLQVKAQTTLSPGDIMFTQLNADGVPTTTYDGFSFVLLKSISSGTQISFSDVGWNPGTASWGGVTGVSEMYFTWTAGTALSCGTEVSISANGGVSASTGSISGVTGGPNLNITNAGESILAYQGTYASPSFISGIINYASGWGWNSGAPVTSCGLPSALTDGVNAIFPSSYDNVRYSCTVTTASTTTLRSALAGFSNWIYDDVTAYSTTPNCITGCSVPISVSSSQTNVSCNGGTNGTATVVASGGAGGFNYSWSPSGGTNATATGLSAGTYICTITDASFASTTKSVTITEPTAITLSPASQTNVSCNGGTNGAATLNTPSGGAGSFSYNWTPGNPTGDGSRSVTGLTAQTYTVTVTDANSCTKTQNFTITEPAAITGSSSISICQGDSVKIGTNYFKTAGQHIATILASNGCDSVVTLNLTIKERSFSSMSKSVCDAYEFNGMTITQSGIYKDTLLNASGCDSVVTLNLTIKERSFSSISKSVCGTYEFNGMTITQSGIYKDTLLNASGCDSVVTLNLTVNPIPENPLPQAKESVCGSGKVGIGANYNARLRGAISSYYKLYDAQVNGNVVDSASFDLTTPLITNSTTYYVSSVINGCESGRVAVDAVVHPLPNVGINASPNDTIDAGELITLSGTGALNYSWNNSVINGVAFVPVDGETYTVEGSDVNGCKNTSSVTVVVNTITRIESSHSANFSVYPNPATAHVTVLFNTSVSGTISIIDLNGRAVMSIPVSGNIANISTADLLSGVYIIKVNADQGITVKQLIIK